MAVPPVSRRQVDQTIRWRSLVPFCCLPGSESVSRSARVEAHEGVTRISIRCALACLLLIGCGPERLVLSGSASDAGSEEPDGEVGDGYTVEDGWFMPCFQEDWECEPGTVCENERCVPCSELPNECMTLCPMGDEPVPSIRNGCPVCVCPSAPCYVHGECPYGSLCSAGSCQSCSEAGDNCDLPCSDRFSLIATVRNGCPVCECAPPSECWFDEDCGGPPMRCYPGAQCDEGCEGDPMCCSGNLCGLIGCDETYYLPCAAVGCPSGLMCMTGCPPPMCTCDPGSMLWTCEPECAESMCVPPT